MRQFVARAPRLLARAAPLRVALRGALGALPPAAAAAAAFSSTSTPAAPAAPPATRGSARPWLASYPADVPPSLDYSAYPSLAALLERNMARFAARPAYKFLGATVTFADVDRQSRALGAYLQGLGLARGDRVAIMLPNVPQFPVAVAAVLRAGFVVVNVNPLYTARELENQLADSGAKAVVILENFAATLQQVVEASPARTLHVVVAALGDSLGPVKGAIVNAVVRHVRKLVPRFSLPGAARFNAALAEGARRPLAAPAPALGPDDLAVLQYTGGTTGVSKGAMLLHRNLVANVLQCVAWNVPALKGVGAGEDDAFTVVCALPLYHIFSFTTNMLVGAHLGYCNILIPNPRDVKALLGALKGETFHSMPAVNTLFGAIENHPDFAQVDWRNLKLSVAGGMAVQSGTAQRWLEKTGCAISEGYGLSETSPVVTGQPTDRLPLMGSIGLPLPDTEVALLNDDGSEAAAGAPGEIAVRGPQVFAGYWQRPDETARAITADGFLLTGDIGTVDERGFFRLIDRKKDMIVVSGFKVFPNEVEDVVSRLPGVLECAAVGVPDARAGEAVKLVVVKKDAGLTEAAVRAHCAAQLAGYKRPMYVEFRESAQMPKTPVGKILRRLLRNAE